MTYSYAREQELKCSLIHGFFINVLLTLLIFRDVSKLSLLLKGISFFFNSIYKLNKGNR